MSRIPAKLTQADVARIIRAAPQMTALLTRDIVEPMSDPSIGTVVYIVRIGKPIKIGFTTNLQSRLKSFQTTAFDIKVLLTLPGDRALERRLHELFAEVRIERELFQADWRIFNFIDHYRYGGLERGLRFLEETTPKRRAERKEGDRQQRVRAVRKTRAALHKNPILPKNPDGCTKRCGHE